MTARVPSSLAAAQGTVLMKCVHCVTILIRRDVLVLNFFEQKDLFT